MILEKQPIFLQLNSSPRTCGMDGESGLLLHNSSAAKLMKSSDFRERTPWSVHILSPTQEKANKAKSMFYPHKFIIQGKHIHFFCSDKKILGKN